MGLIDQWKQSRQDKVQSRAWDAFARNDVQGLLNELTAGASANTLNGAGQTLVHRMVMEDRPMMERALGGAMVDWSVQLPDGRSFLHLAVETNQSRWVRVGLDHQVPLELETLNGHTALHLAAKMGSTPMIRMLDSAGCSWSALDKKSQTPLDMLTNYPVLKATWEKIISTRPSAYLSGNAREQP